MPKLETIFSFGQTDQHELQYDPIKGMLYLNGDKLVTEKRFSSVERGFAVAGLLLGVVATIASVIQAWAAIGTTRSDFELCTNQLAQEIETMTLQYRAQIATVCLGNGNE